MPDIIEERLQKLKANWKGAAGCNEEEVLKLEDHYKVTLPHAYKTFLMLMGWDGGHYQIGSDFTYKWLFTMKGYANDMLNKCGYPSLPLDAFVFHMHQGYQFSFFYINGEDDPAVYYFNECYDFGILKVADHITDYFLDATLVDKAITTAIPADGSWRSPCEE